MSIFDDVTTRVGIAAISAITIITALIAIASIL